MNNRSTRSSTPTEGIDSSSEEEVDELEAHLSSKDLERQAEIGEQSQRQADVIGSLIDEFLKEPRVKKDENVLVYWESKKLIHPILYFLSQIVLAVPATQVSVERLFSGLKLLLSPQRDKLNEDVLDDLMFIRTNSLFNL